MMLPRYAMRLTAVLIAMSSPRSPPSAPRDARIDALIARMTLAEKLGQLICCVNGRPSPEQLEWAARESRWLLQLARCGRHPRRQHVAVTESRLRIP